VKCFEFLPEYLLSGTTLRRNRERQAEDFCNEQRKSPRSLLLDLPSSSRPHQKCYLQFIKCGKKLSILFSGYG
jgi:hypothetical protein